MLEADRQIQACRADGGDRSDCPTLDCLDEGPRALRSENLVFILVASAAGG